jgi:hypothetical protein
MESIKCHYGDDYILGVDSNNLYGFRKYATYAFASIGLHDLRPGQITAVFEYWDAISRTRSSFSKMQKSATKLLLRNSRKRKNMMIFNNELTLPIYLF